MNDITSKYVNDTLRQFSQMPQITANSFANLTNNQVGGTQTQQSGTASSFSSDASFLSPQASTMQGFSYSAPPSTGSNSSMPQTGYDAALDANAQSRINSINDFLNSLFGGSSNSGSSGSGFGFDIPTTPTYPDFTTPTTPTYPDFSTPTTPTYPDYSFPGYSTPTFPDYSNPTVPGTSNNSSYGMSTQAPKVLGYGSIESCDDSTQALADELITTGQCTAEQLTILQMPNSGDKYNEVYIDQGDNGGIVVTVNGDHKYSYTAEQAKSLIISGGSGEDRIYGNCSNDLNIAGGDGHNIIRGGSGNDIIYGGSGSDHIYGGAGKDEIFGGNGFDELYGGTGDDYIYGGRGNDTIDGGRGYDTIYGGAGDDKINGGNDRNRDVLYGGDGSDTFGEGEDLTNYRYDSIKDKKSYDTLAYKDADGKGVYY